MRFLLKALLFTLMLLLVACSGQRVKGDGKVVTKQRNVANFIAIKVAGNFNVTIGAKDTGLLTIKTDSNLVPYVETYVKKDMLYINAKNGYQLKPSNRLNVFVNASKFKEVKLSGMNMLSAANIKASDLNIDASGKNILKLAGKANVLQIRTSGVSTVNARKLVAKEVDLATTGDLIANVYASNKIKIKTSGNSKITYYGNPQHVTQHLSGNSDVRPAK